LITRPASTARSVATNVMALPRVSQVVGEVDGVRAVLDQLVIAA
jgi:hypothetical protein